MTLRLVGVSCLILSLATISQATPRMSLPAGSPCATCHYSATGGGARNPVGWGAMSKSGAFDFQLFKSNQPIKNRLAIGFDSRIQWAHFGIPVRRLDTAGKDETVIPDYKVIPMQLQVNAAYSPTSSLSISGGYNAGPNTYKGDACDPVFPGMSCFDVAIQVQSDKGLSARAGMIQPQIGIRPDDHTTIVRGDASNLRRPIIPPNYAEWGGEVAYQPRSWIRAELGVFDSNNLDASLNNGVTEARQQTDLWPVSYGGRFTVLPRFEVGGASKAKDDFDDDFSDTPPVKSTAIHTWFGASLYGSGDFYLLNGFMGAGLQNGLETRLEVARSRRGADYETLNASWALTWAFVDWLVPAIRIDRGQTDAAEQLTTWQYVAGVEFFLLPGLEIRPEYRILKTDHYVFGQPTIQIHAFF
jgi:hypothetical protein